MGRMHLPFGPGSRRTLALVTVALAWASFPAAPSGAAAAPAVQVVASGLNFPTNFAFAPDDIHILIETPEKTFAEYVAHARAAATGRTLHQLFTGYLVAEAGEIKLLRETFNPLAMAQAQLPNGVADIGPPGDEVHSF